MTYYDKEMAKLEKQQAELRKQQESNIIDRHNTIADQTNINDYKRIINSSLQITPNASEKLKNYIQRLQIYQEISYTKNWETHVDNGRKTWYTHKTPLGCFMCQDQQFISVLIQVLQFLSSQNPKLSF